MRKFFNQHAKTMLIMGILLIVYFLIRSINLTIIPIFTDEAIYLRWAQIALGDASWRLISLIDGKQPLFIWLTMIAMKFINDPLVAGRTVSILSGSIGVVGMFFLGREVSKKESVGITASVLYIGLPIFLVYDRLALMDGLLAALAIWSVYLTLLLVKTIRLDVALLLGMLIGVSFLTKSSANFFLLFLPISLILFDFKKSSWKVNLIKWLGCALCVVVISQSIYTILRLSPYYHMIGLKDHTFILTVSEFLKNPLIYAQGNLQGLLTWLGEYVTWPMFLLFILSILWVLKKNLKMGLVLLIWFLLPLFALSFFGKIIYPRYLLFMVITLPIFLAIFITEVYESKQRRLIQLGLLLCFIPVVWFDFALLFSPIRAPLPGADRDQLLDQWPAGYGVNEVVLYVQNQSKNEKVYLATEGTFGLFPAAFELYLNKNVNVTMSGHWPVNEVPAELLEKAKTNKTYLVFKERQDVPKDWPLKLIKEIPRGSGKTYLRLYQVVPK